MSEITPPQEQAASHSVGGSIVIEVSEDNVRYDSELSLPEVVFWLDVVRTMIVRKVLAEG